MNHLKIISQKNVLKTKWFDVNEDTVETPLGSKHIHHNIVRTPAVSIFPISGNYELYLIKQYRYLLEKTIIEACSGFIDENEDPLGAAKRELSEELGLTADIWIDLGPVNMSASVVMSVQHLFVAKGIHEGKSHQEETEDITMIKLPLSEAVQKVMSGEISTGATKIGILMIDKMRQEGKI